MAAELRFGVVGLGIASTQILPAFAELDGVSVTAACDVREEGLTKFKSEYGGETYTSVEDMCKSPNVDAVYICSPNHLHAEQVITAAELGKQVIVEKPMGLTLDECEAMNQAAERNGVRLLCGHTHSFDPPVRKMRELVVGGDLGPLRMVQEIVELESLTLGQVKLAISPCNSRELQDEVAATLVAVADNAGVEILVAGESFTFNGDRQRVVQALVNLASNAIRFSPRASRVTLSSRTLDGAVCFQVRDSGPGIAETDIDRIFEKFQQVDNADTRIPGGSGLGLAITKGIVEQHGGRIWVESVEGEGSVFQITIPIRA
ncbi:MAG: Gfo/Idh/MocA family oxidoreductase [Chloroflexi bacterium]|nr:Gfo/Idh/MocA family oxidoreductase [Chloroflexota bacterium]MDA1174307.1 Gfo/Idh/MocA family oxidoreductase [Chloroflexota bacterium]